MKKLLCCACAAVLSLAAVSPCFAAAADSPWNGTWKENEAKSTLSGNTVTYMAKRGGQFHYSNGGSIEYDFACDGKAYPTISDRSPRHRAVEVASHVLPRRQDDDDPWDFHAPRRDVVRL
jgi:hypothetical protein